MSVTFAVELFDDALIEEAKPLLDRHYQELARQKDIVKLNPNFEYYKEMSKHERFVVFTVRKDRALIGYAAYWVKPHNHYLDVIWAISDLIIIMPEHRGTRLGWRLLDFIEAEMQRRGVGVLYTIEKIAHPALGRLLVAKGHKAIETGYAKEFL